MSLWQGIVKEEHEHSMSCHVVFYRFPSSGQVAGDGYVNPQWSLNQLVLFPSGNFAIVWMELRSVSFYCKAQEL